MSSKISPLPAMTALVGTEQLTGVQAGENRNATPTLIKDFVQPYKVYRALLTQSGTDAPMATVLENSLGGALVWSRINSGRYRGTLIGAFPSGKVFTMVNPVLIADTSVSQSVFSIFRNDNDSITFDTADVAGIGNYSDDIAFINPIEILVYP